jgi:hypothetical protein
MHISFAGLAAGAPDAVGHWVAWVVVGSAVICVICLLAVVITVGVFSGRCRALAEGLAESSASRLRWSEIAQRQTELWNSPLLKVTNVAELPEDHGGGTQILLQNVGFGTAANVKCVFVEHGGEEHPVTTTEIVGRESAAFDQALKIETLSDIRLEYLSPCGSYAHTTQYVIKSGGQTYALHRRR